MGVVRCILLYVYHVPMLSSALGLVTSATLLIAIFPVNVASCDKGKEKMVLPDTTWTTAQIKVTVTSASACDV